MTRSACTFSTRGERRRRRGGWRPHRRRVVLWRRGASDRGASSRHHRVLGRSTIGYAPELTERKLSLALTASRPPGGELRVAPRREDGRRRRVVRTLCDSFAPSDDVLPGAIDSRRKTFPLEDGAAANAFPDARDIDVVRKDLQTLCAFANKTNAARPEHGAVELESAELRFETDARTKSPTEVIKKAEVPMMRVVAELMILANSAARSASSVPRTALLRRHAPPREEVSPNSRNSPRRKASNSTVRAAKR